MTRALTLTLTLTPTQTLTLTLTLTLALALRPEYEQVQELYQLAREIELKKLYLDQQGASLELRLCPLLTPPTIWAAGKLLGSKQARAQHPPRWPPSPRGPRAADHSPWLHSPWLP